VCRESVSVARIALRAVCAALQQPSLARRRRRCNMLAAAPWVAAVLALLALAPSVAHGARSHADLASRKTEDVFNKRPLKREEVSGGSSQPYLDSVTNQQQSDEDAGDDDLGGGGAVADHHRYTTGHTVLSKPPAPGSYIPSNCSVCVSHEEIRRLSKQKIQEDILQKLGMRHAPNMTGRPKPKIPPLERLIENFGMQGDQPDRFQPGESFHEEDDFHAKTTMVIVVAQTSKYHFFSSIFKVEGFPICS
jgi:hypothetical protein